MNYKRILFTAVALWFTTTVVTFSIKPDYTADSIRMQMKHLTGEDLLRAYTNLCFLAATQDDIYNELATLREFIDEANRQNNIEAEGLARSMQIMCYYNYDMGDSLKKTLPDNLAFMHKHGLWNHYYASWSSLVELHIYDDNLQTALLEAEKMYADAKENNSNYGIGVSAYCIGSIYQIMQRFLEAKQSLQESIVALSIEEDISLLLSAYNALAETLDGLEQYEELRTITLEWKAILDNYKHTVEAIGFTSLFNNRYLDYTLAATLAEIGTKQYKRAAKLLSEAEILVGEDKMISRYKFLQVQTRYYAATNQYDKAIASNNENIANLFSIGDSVSLLTVRLQQAKLLLISGQQEAAIELYKQTIPRKDKLFNRDLITQLNEMRKIYELDRLTLKNKIVTYRFYFFLVSSSLLLIVVILSIIYARRLRHKNRMLYNTYIQLLRKEEKLSTIEVEPKEEELSSDEILYNNLNKLMQEEQLHKDYKINREDISLKLNTNRTYLAAAIKKHSDGLTFSEFINSYRLRNAANLLTTNPNLNISEVADESGFNSRSTFNRLFLDYYGMSPSEFRAIAKEDKITTPDF